MAFSPRLTSSGGRRSSQTSARSGQGNAGMNRISMSHEQDRRTSLTTRDDRGASSYAARDDKVMAKLQENCSRNRDDQECLSCLRGLQADVDQINEALQHKVNIPQFREASQALRGVEEAIARLNEMASVGSERLRQLELKVQDQVGAAFEDMKRLRTESRNTQAQLEQSIAVWAKSKGREANHDPQQMWESLSATQSKVRALEALVQKNLGGEQIPEMRSAIANMQKFLTSRNQFQDLNGSISSNQMQDIKIALREMARVDDLQQLKNNFSDMQMQLTIVEKIAHDRVSTQRLQQHSDAVHQLEKKINDMQKEFSAGVIHMEDARGTMTAMQMKLGRLEHNSSVDSVTKSGADLDELRHGIDSVKSQIGSLDQILRTKADTSQLEALSDTVQSVERKLLRNESGLPCTAQSGLETDEKRMSEVAATALKTQLRDLDQAMAEKVDVSEYRQVKSAVTNLQAQMASLTQVSHDNVGMDAVQQYKASIISVQAQLHTLKQELSEKADVENMQKLKGALSNMQIHVTNLDQTVQERAGSEQMNQICASVAEAKSKLCSIEQHKAEASAMQQLQDTVAAMQSKLPTSERVQQLETTVTSLGRHVTSLEQGKIGKAANVAEQAGFADVHTQVELQHFKGVIAGMEKKVTDVEQDLQDKVCKADLQQCRKLSMTLDTKLISLEQLLNEKASTVQLQQVQGMLQTSISSVEQMVHEKVGPEQLQPLKASLSGVQANVANVEQSLHEKAGSSQIQQLKGNLAMVQNKACGLEQALQEKAPACQVQQLKDALSGVQSKICGVEQSVKANQNMLADAPTMMEMPQRLKRLRAVECPTEPYR